MGYLSTTDTYTVSDQAQEGYSGTVKATLTVTAGTGNSCNWSVSVSRSNYNYFKIYLKIDGTVHLNDYITTNSKSWSKSDTGTISGDTVSIKLGISASVNDTSSTYMTFIEKDLTRTKWTNVTAGTCSITDNYNNTFTLNGTKGSSGTNNTAGGPTLKWGYTTDCNGSFTDGETKILAIPETIKENATRRVHAKSITTATHGSNAEKTTFADIKQYVAPTAPSNPKIEPKTKNKLTVRDTWKLSWTAGRQENSSSPIKGYRVRLYKKINGVFTGLNLEKGIINVGNGKADHLTNVGSTHVDYYYFDTNSTSTELELDPVELGLKAGDYVKLGVFSHTNYGASNEGKQLFCSSQICSQEYLINNAGIVRVKAGGTWREGQVWVKVGGTWKEATSVHTKVNGIWKEST